jgi:2-methylcitrate dehydratase
MPTISRRIAEWVAAQSYDQLPPETIHQVKRRIIDTIGVALGAFHAKPTHIVRAVAESVHDTRAATVWGSTHSTRPGLAAFANGTMVRYLDFNDTYISLEPCHPSDNIPAVVAVAQTAGLTGQDTILGIVIAYEVECRLCDADSLWNGGWDHAVFGALSTAAAGGRLWGLDADGLDQALGLAGVCNIATRQTRRGQISMWKACTFANAAKNGVFAADLARRGLTGPDEVFQGPRGLMNQLSIPNVQYLKLAQEGDYRIERTHIKAWPAGYFSQSAIDAILQLRPQIELDQIESIRIGTFEAAARIIGSEPETQRPTVRETADHSMPFCTAVALTDGEVTPASFAEDRLSDPQVLSLVDKIEITEVPELNEVYPRACPNHLTVTLSDGRKLEKRVDHPRGHIKNPMTDDQLVAKFRRLTDGVITDQAADRILDRAWHLDELTDLRQLFEFPVLQPDANAPGTRPKLVPKRQAKEDG